MSEWVLGWVLAWELVLGKELDLVVEPEVAAQVSVVVVQVPVVVAQVLVVEVLAAKDQVEAQEG